MSEDRLQKHRAQITAALAQPAPPILVVGQGEPTVCSFPELPLMQLRNLWVGFGTRFPILCHSVRPRTHVFRAMFIQEEAVIWIWTRRTRSCGSQQCGFVRTPEDKVSGNRGEGVSFLQVLEDSCTRPWKSAPASWEFVRSCWTSLSTTPSARHSIRRC